MQKLDKKMVRAEQKSIRLAHDRISSRKAVETKKNKETRFAIKKQEMLRR